ncbi:uncharacterized protein LOC109805561 [Cajanus cajan]|uniref:Uncharacterized protein n=1 Tax=Cajanus cajan TaxID=3821 RepID=A0A151SUW7_CAJCA|nr:uncharacterized protein LOC109805561 [Cajanus cajan]KYP58595.1 hypothetical protein KK1_014009 [Cajanus cajan]
MASARISDCVKDSRLPLRPTFVNLYKWPESDVEFVKTVNSNSPRGIDSFSCRQMYLRSYKFSRKKVGVTQKTLKCFNKLKESVVCATNRLNFKGKCKVLGRAKDVTFAAFSIFQTLLPCSAKVDVLHRDF